MPEHPIVRHATTLILVLTALVVSMTAFGIGLQNIIGIQAGSSVYSIFNVMLGILVLVTGVGFITFIIKKLGTM